MKTTLTLAQQQAASRLRWVVTRTDKGDWRIDDAVIATFYVGSGDRSKCGVYIHRKLDDAWAAAVAVRKEHDAEMERRRGFSTKPLPGRPDTVQTKQVKAVIAKQAAPAAPAPVVATPLPPPRPRVMIEDDDEPAPVAATIELDDVELDNTGERVKKPRELPRRSKSVNMYQSAVKVLIKHPRIGQEALAKQAVLALESAKRCRLAWDEALAALAAAGYLTASGKRFLSLPKDGSTE